jgi:hypothetical protein
MQQSRKTAAQSTSVILEIGFEGCGSFASRIGTTFARLLYELATSTGGVAYYPHADSELLDTCSLVALDLRINTASGITQPMAHTTARGTSSRFG